MDVEDLVRWVCGQELTKRRPPSSRSLPGLNLKREDASLVGRWMWPPGFPEISPMFARGFATAKAVSRSGNPDPDALIVEAEILSLAGPMRELQAPAEIGDGIGLEVDIAGAFAAAAANVVNLVLAHGRLGNRPHAGLDRLTVHPKLAGNGKPGVWRLEQLMDKTLDGEGVAVDYEQPLRSIRRDLYAPGAYCKIDFEPPVQLIINDRSERLVWRLALDELAARLSGALETITALPPAAALMPWTGERDGERLRDLFGAGATQLHGAAETLALASQRAAGVRRSPRAGQARMRRPAKPARSATAG